MGACCQWRNEDNNMDLVPANPKKMITGVSQDIEQQFTEMIRNLEVPDPLVQVIVEFIV